MNRILAAITAVFFAGPALAMECDGIDFELRDTLQDTLKGAESPRVSGLAMYLNEAFYTDLTCRLTQHRSEDQIAALIADPEALMSAAMALTTSRNQSDALMLILLAMQQTIEN